jgi:hypothetical protein
MHWISLSFISDASSKQEPLVASVIREVPDAELARHTHRFTLSHFFSMNGSFNFMNNSLKFLNDSFKPVTDSVRPFRVVKDSSPA